MPTNAASIAFALGMVFGLLVLAEFLRRFEHIKGEVARKFVHMTVGSFVASWGFILSLAEIRWLCVAFLVVVLADRHFKIFKSIHSVRRQTIGDVMFPLGIALVTFITGSPWIFAVAILHLSLGDAVAAVIGQHYHLKYAYEILKQKKSVVGSVAFFVTSVLIMLVFLLWSPLGVEVASSPLLILLPIMATLLEGLSIFGLDNVTVPVFVALLLTSLQVI
jgi:phytol kinase